MSTIIGVDNLKPNKSAMGILSYYIFVFLVLLISNSFAFIQTQNNRINSAPLRESTKNSLDHESSSTLSADSIYFGIEISDTPIGRLVFHLTNPSPLPLHAENLIQLAKGSRRSIDPQAHYVNCEFDFSPASVEDGMGRYRWGHQLKGRGRNAIGRPDQPIVDKENQLKSTHSCFGGQYYGDEYIETLNDDPDVLLTVPIMGPGHGFSKFSIVRVGESPKEWGERLLLNSGVIGRMDPESLQVLHMMARQRVAPPRVIEAGVLLSKDTQC